MAEVNAWVNRDSLENHKKKIPTFVSMIESRSKRLCSITTQSQ